MTKIQLAEKILKARPKFGVSSLELGQRCHTTNPFDLVLKLRKKGRNITTKIVEGKDLFGNKCRYARYYMEAKQ